MASVPRPVERMSHAGNPGASALITTEVELITGPAAVVYVTTATDLAGTILPATATRSCAG